MKLKFHLLIGAIIAAGASLSTSAQTEPSHKRLGAEKPISDFLNIQVKNLQGQSLGRVTDLGVDLVNGRIVEVLLESDGSLDVGHKIVAVPPLALVPDAINKVYLLNVSTDTFKTAAAIDLSKWVDSGRSNRIADAYRLFAQEPYFLEEGDTASASDERPKVSLGYVERASKLLDLPVGNLQGEKFGVVTSMSLDIPKGRILHVVVLAPGNFKTKSVIPAMALSFNSTRDGLLLDDTKIEYADEPRFVLTEAAFGQKAYSREESYKGPHTSVALEQGSSYRDVGRTVRINREIRAARLNGRHVEIGTLNGRVTLRGWVYTIEDKQRIGAIAIAASRLELVDNQIEVGRPITVN